MKANVTRWTSPILGERAEEDYRAALGEEGAGLLAVLESAPYEVAVVSRLLAALAARGRREEVR